jgi:hypothetical protein
MFAYRHTAACIRTLLQHFNWELFDNLPYSTDLALSGYHLVYLPEELVEITVLQQ